VFSKRLINPTAVCIAVHMCPDDSVSVTDDNLIVLQKWIGRMLPDDSSHGQSDPVDNHTQWTSLSSYKPVTINNKPVTINNKSVTINNHHSMVTSDGTNNRPLKILQISDLHVDRLYTEVGSQNLWVNEFSARSFVGYSN